MSRRFYIFEDKGAVSFLLERPGQHPKLKSQPFESPLTGENLDQLRWYLEDYLRAPYAV